MAPPTKKALVSALNKAVDQFWKEDREKVTITNCRSRAEKDLSLAEGFFVEEEWKAESKTIIKDRVAKLQDEDEGENTAISSPEKPKKAQPRAKKVDVAKKPTKRSSNANAKAQPRKRQKKESTPSDIEDELRDNSEDEMSEPSSDSSESSSAKKTSNKKQPVKSKSTSQKKNDSEEVLSDSALSEVASVNSLQATKTEDSDTDDGIIDSGPKPKRSRAKDPKGKSTTTKAAKSKPPPKNISPDEAEMKTLQSQLRKCGVTKIFAFELKKFGDDNKAKIRHLKSMLVEVGMTGRFSEARANEIKERRELEADVEAISAVDLGSTRQRRSKMNASKSLREEKVDLGSDVEDDGGEESEAVVEQRAVAAKQDLAFLGSESDSD